MTTEEFNAGIRELTQGIPITLVINRLILLLREVLEAGGEPGATAFQAFIAAKCEDEDE